MIILNSKLKKQDYTCQDEKEIGQNIQRLKEILIERLFAVLRILQKFQS